MTGFTLDKTHSNAADVSSDTTLALGSLPLDTCSWAAFRLFNATDIDSPLLTLTLQGAQAGWFRFAKWRHSKEVTSSVPLYVLAGRCSDTLWLRCLIPLDADLTSPEAWVQCHDPDYGRLSLSFSPIDSFDGDTDPYPERAGEETENILAYFATSAEATQVSLKRYDPLPVPQTADAWGSYPVGDRQAAAQVDRHNERVGYCLIDTFRQKVFLGDRIPAFLHSQMRLQTNYDWTDSIKVVLPPTGYLQREWALFSEKTQGKVAKYKRTVYECEYQGARFSLDNVAPIFAYNGQIAFFSAEAIAVQEPGGSNVNQEIPYNKLYRYKSHRPIDYIQSFIPEPETETEYG